MIYCKPFDSDPGIKAKGTAVTQPVTVRPVRPAPDSLTSFFWDGAREHRLLIQRCDDCGRFQHPPEPVCHHCLSFSLSAAEVSGRGTIYSFEIATQAFHPWFADKIPFVIAVVELIEQPNLKLITNIVEVDPDSAGIQVGAEVEVTWRKLDDEFTLPVFRLTTREM
jgi:uncharacterized protein